MKKISIIIPTYKPQDYLWECLDSLNNQTFPKESFEVILVLNGCNEPYKSKIEQYVDSKMQDVNVVFIHTLQGGVSNARNIALDNAKSEYITFIDDDDFVSPTFLDDLYAKASYDSIVLCYPYAFDDGNVQQQLPYYITDVYEVCHKKLQSKLSSKVRSFFSGPCMKLIPMNIIRERRFDVRLRNGEDTLFMFLISDRIKDIKFTTRNAIYYRRNRLGSAVNQVRSSKEIISSNMLQIKAYCNYYIKSPLKYNFSFFLSRVGGALRAIILTLYRKIHENSKHYRWSW